MRYEGTPQRDLFRELRLRFLSRHTAGRTGWSLDVGSGPLRFTRSIGGASVRHVALDLSQEMLRRGRVEIRPEDAASTDVVRGDGLRPPFPTGAFQCVALLGNSLGFAGSRGQDLLAAVLDLVAPSGTAVLEIAPGPGERSRYLSRLPPGSVGRLLRSPVPLIEARVRGEGFTVEPARRADPGDFARWDASALTARLRGRGFGVRDTLAVAPALGPDADRTAKVRADPKAWSHLLELEERLGRDPDRWPRAAAVLVAATLPAGGMIM